MSIVHPVHAAYTPWSNQTRKNRLELTMTDEKAPCLKISCQSGQFLGQSIFANMTSYWCEDFLMPSRHEMWDYSTGSECLIMSDATKEVPFSKLIIFLIITQWASVWHQVLLVRGPQGEDSQIARRKRFHTVSLPFRKIMYLTVCNFKSQSALTVREQSI